ncbi:hypothetical protein [Chryseobacterium sp. MEBOG07]|uniref:hypothetical protein n=1 Tax=Chryseobacterium sp. MEBOG07 TaxID=2879939 RepID=UPI001F372A84|nr:hypothetical protein [Chryseobacterium sp. MEBOG07]UKB79191.1 hypothetical protein LF886_22645 [Chryseobacterium sp. MEBOG07]
MKTLTYKLGIIIFFFNIILVFAQNGVLSKKDLKSDSFYNKIEETKSGNWKDVLTDFMQASFKGLTSENKSFQFKANIFSLRAKADSTLLIDYNYTSKRETFYRNFQVQIGLNLDNDYKFKGFNYGFDWAIINKRDTTIASLAREEYESGKYFEKLSSALIFALQKYRNIAPSDKYEKVEKLAKESIEKQYYLPIDNLPDDFKKILLEEQDGIDAKKFLDTFQNELGRFKRRPLLTIGFHSNFQKNTKFLDEFDANLVYLQGLKSKKGSKLEIDFRNQFKAKDSITTSVIKRKEFSSQLGLNISIWETKEKSIVELKPNFEYKRIVSGIMTDEKNDQFLANADLRIRILKNLWVPLILKYDIKNNNLFGFLNVSFNFDAMKKE